MASSIMNQMNVDSIISPEACIFRTPSILKRHNEAAFVPNKFSIGPFHHGKEELADAQRIKLKYLEGLVARRGGEAALSEWISAVKKVEKKARKCYAGGIGMSEKDFFEMLILDGCFIIELLRKEALPKDNDDPIFTVSSMLQFLHQDLILLENQIPWFVLENLFGLTGGLSENKTLVQLALDFFEFTFTPNIEPIQMTLVANQEIKHILDLLRLSLVLPLPPPENEQTVAWEPLPSATKLAESGIKFKEVKSQSILEIRFADGKFLMPSLLIQEILEPTLRNLISYEQCYPNCPARVTSYAMLLDNLINTAEDIDELAKSGILINWLNPQDATRFFQKLYQDTYVKDLYYQGLFSQVKDFRRRHWWPRWKAFYKRNFGKPWGIVSQVVGGTVTVAAVIQTVFTVMSYKK